MMLQFVRIGVFLTICRVYALLRLLRFKQLLEKCIFENVYMLTCNCLLNLVPSLAMRLLSIVPLLLFLLSTKTKELLHLHYQDIPALHGQQRTGSILGKGFPCLYVPPCSQ